MATAERKPKEAPMQVGQKRMSLRSSGKRLIDLGLLYVSKSGAIIVGLLILPFFSRQLGPDLFGVVALILSLQSFLILLDFGMATMVGRELAIVQATDSQRYITWRAAEWLVSALYLGISPLALLIPTLLGSPWGVVEVLSCVILFWALTLQNIGQNALFARRKFSEAAIVQLFGLLARHGVTAIALVCVGASLTSFIISQSAVAVVQMLVTRWRCNLDLCTHSEERFSVGVRTHAAAMLRRGRALMLFGLAGAAVLQLDKVIVSVFMSPRELGPYFLATTFCLAPISVLAAPVAQFFQPRLVQALSSENPAAVQLTLNQFIASITACSLLPTALIWLLREPLIALWLQDGNDVAQVAHYSSVLLPGVAIGALGYIPYSMLIAKQDYGFQARLSLALTAVTLTAVMISAIHSSVFAICLVYALYHSVSTICSWWRCTRIDATVGNIAAAGALYASILVSLLFSVVVFFAAIAAHFN
ncbi:lipopolysaccharide biosynthesis protein [Chitinimonas taiwanensis]|uniref:lipopolysaccharide biosynthesis protein n=1 Tax=Chitinimonas taiwanensis TaxID=240412 RepID=UPI0035B281B3